MPNEVCSKCHEDFMNCKCEQFHPNIIDLDAYIIIQKLMQFRWKWQGYGKLSCSSCGSIAYDDSDGKGVYRTDNEKCSNSCPWNLAEMFLKRYEDV